ncbi:hypothetical protein CDL12_10903 [Handroanthus impetiginosus]|uniref:Uncharacterized protein n=1 Tax=Handroanthus impetiginosus TaxID=429701 RepID=A0A2G9HFX3_9LAMI|nr:hypothetical protein CDL12_10903 [Handroanthus impetiginosus]
MASVASSNSATIHSFQKKPISQNLILSPFLASFPLYKSKFCAIKTGPDGGGAVRSSQEAADLLRKPVASPPAGNDDDESEMKSGDGDAWVDWEDKILEDIMPLVSFVRMILHSGKWLSEISFCQSRLIIHTCIVCNIIPEEYMLEQDGSTIGYHPNFESSRCLFIVRKDGELVDFSYWKCIKGLIITNYPLYADSFILRHFKRRRRSD